ncbi:MAG: UbiA family prenyltransferase, partial [Pseudomonadota bacterium]
REGDYGRAGVPMMPNVKGAASTRRQIFVYALLLSAAGLAPPALGFAGLFYGAAATILGGLFVMRAYAVLKAAPGDNKPAKRLFGFSIFFLFAIFGALLIEGLLAYV